jgi:hypothetical protein
MVRDNTNSNALPFRVEAGAPHSSLVISSSGVVAAEVASFSGDGSLLTNLAPASLQPGTAAINITGNAAPASLFGSFGGEGTIDMTVSGIQNLGTTVAEYQNLTIPAGSTLVVDKGFALIGVSGTCDIAGRIDANGKGRAGGALVSGKNLPGLPGQVAAVPLRAVVSTQRSWRGVETAVAPPLRAGVAGVRVARGTSSDTERKPAGTQTRCGW